MTFIYAYTIGNFIHVSTFTIKDIPNWLVWLILFLVLNSMLAAVPVLTVILLALFWMMVCMLDLGMASFLSGTKSHIPNTPFHTTASIAANVTNLLFSVGAFLAKGVVAGEFWATTVLAILVLSEVFRLTGLLLATGVSYLSKWTGKTLSSLCGTAVYLAGIGYYVYMLLAKYDGFTALVYGLSQVFGGGVRCVF